MTDPQDPPPPPSPAAIELGDGLRLQQFIDDDAEALFAVIDGFRGALLPYMRWALDVKSPADMRELIGRWTEQTQTTGAVSLGVELEGRWVGAVFHLRPNAEDRNVEIGYWLTPAARGRGVATRAVRALFDWTFRELDYRRAYLRIAAHNAPSIALAERLGLEREGVMRDLWQIEPGVWWDGVVFAGTADRWPPRDTPRHPQSQPSESEPQETA
ncbi:MAG: GNAT family protein [Planctomycetota bacterium]